MTYLPEPQMGEEPLAASPTGGRKTPQKKKHNRKPDRKRHARLRLARKQAKIDWMHENCRVYQSSFLKKLCLGTLPARAAKYGFADFDLSEARTYCGESGEEIAGHKLAGLAAYIVRCARDPLDYLYSLRNVPSKMIEPIKTYLRVKLALGRLEAEIAAHADITSTPLGRSEAFDVGSANLETTNMSMPSNSMPLSSRPNAV